MKIIGLIASFLLIGIIGFTPDVFSQEYTDTPPTFKVALKYTTPFFYQDSDGYTVVVGAIENNNSLSSIKNVIVRAILYNDTSIDPLEITSGITIMDVIPPNRESPFVIRSETPNLSVTNAVVSIYGFEPSRDKTNGLTILSNNTVSNSPFSFSGVLQNGDAPNSETNVYVAFYDTFEPPRILSVSTIELGHVAANTETPFKIQGDIDSSSIGFLVFAESDIFYSDVIDVKIPPPAFIVAAEVTPEVTPLPFKYSSPLFQMKYLDKMPSEVQCNDTRELIIKQSTEKSACVFPSTAQKLIERGWALPLVD